MSGLSDDASERARLLALQIAHAPEDAVRDVLAVAGPDIFGALAILTQAVGAIVGERADAHTRTTVVQACGIALARAAARRGFVADRAQP